MQSKEAYSMFTRAYMMECQNTTPLLAGDIFTSLDSPHHIMPDTHIVDIGPGMLPIPGYSGIPMSPAAFIVPPLLGRSGSLTLLDMKPENPGDSIVDRSGSYGLEMVTRAMADFYKRISMPISLYQYYADLINDDSLPQFPAVFDHLTLFDWLLKQENYVTKNHTKTFMQYAVDQVSQLVLSGGKYFCYVKTKNREGSLSAARIEKSRLIVESFYNSGLSLENAYLINDSYGLDERFFSDGLLKNEPISKYIDNNIMRAWHQANWLLVFKKP